MTLESDCTEYRGLLLVCNKMSMSKAGMQGLSQDIADPSANHGCGLSTAVYDQDAFKANVAMRVSARPCQIAVLLLTHSCMTSMWACRILLL